MNPSLSPIEATKKMMTMVSELEKRAEKAVERQEHMANVLMQTVREVDSKQLSMANDFKQMMRQEVSQIVQAVVDQERQQWNTALTTMRHEVEAMTRSINQERQQTAKQAKILSWQAITVVGATALILFGGSIYLLSYYANQTYQQHQQLQEIQNKIQSLKLRSSKKR